MPSAPKPSIEPLGVRALAKQRTAEAIVDAALPPPPGGKSWHRVVDTNLPPPADFVEHGEGGVGARYNVAPRGAVMLVAK